LASHGLCVVGAARDGHEAVNLARTLKPDVILMDVKMPHGDGLTATRQIKAEMPDAKIVMLTTSDDDQDLFEAVKSGAFGYLVKSISADELLEALDQVQQGIPPFSPGLAAKILSEFAQRAAPPVPGNSSGDLTPRQREVLHLVAQGRSYKEAGAELGLSARTIKYHMAEILKQLHLENRAQVLAYAGRLGLADKPHQKT
jgi:DNA-binding NarL/FixJ family response regulator